MSAKVKNAMEAVKKLKAQAQAGDVGAKLKLRNLEATILGAVNRQREHSLLRLVDRGFFDTSFEVPGAYSDPPTDDEIENADQAMRSSEAKGADGLGQRLAVRDQHWQALADEAPFSRINPPSILRGMAGNTQDLTMVQQNAASNQRPPMGQVAFWPGDDAETLPVTVGLANYAPFSVIQSFIEAPPTTAPIRPYGILTFGTRGVLQRIEVDIGLGCQFTVPASQATLQVALDVVRAGLYTVFPTVKLGGSLSFWPCQKNAPITRTVYVDGLASGGTTTSFNVPLYSKTLVVVGTTQIAAIKSPAFSVLIGDSNGARIGAVVVAANTQMAVIELPNDAAVVTISNDEAGLNANFRAIFGLSL